MWHDIEIGWLHNAASSRRTPSAYLEAVMSAAKQYGPPREVNGNLYVRIHQTDYDNIAQSFNPASVQVQGYTASKLGLGDMIHKVAGPIGRAINWPCLKGDGSTDLRPGSPCDKIKSLANKLTS